ncbi:hypothetical protein BIV24_23295 [Streptomyces colonosanans]|uniref:Uncharacterized protein n=1 Tax=Streptomyces colonosanans TaxID=1428652 RepID=A0A1S2P2V9_9ACTN|nr:hypothetical protein BIV24_23295 [Streptomyces colonosanans]
MFGRSAARRGRYACSTGRDSAGQSTEEPAVIGTAAQPVPIAYSWRPAEHRDRGRPGVET